MPLPGDSSDRRALVRDALAHLAAAAPGEDGRPGRPTALAHPDELIQAYRIALADILQFLGAVEPAAGPGGLRVTSVQASYFLHLLIALLDTGEPLVADWTRYGVSIRGAVLARSRSREPGVRRLCQ